jgi:hypothetical protein
MCAELCDEYSEETLAAMHQGRALPAPRTLGESGNAKRSVISDGHRSSEAVNALP